MPVNGMSGGTWGVLAEATGWGASLQDPDPALAVQSLQAYRFGTPGLSAAPPLVCAGGRERGHRETGGNRSDLARIGSGSGRNSACAHAAALVAVGGARSGALERGNGDGAGAAGQPLDLAGSPWRSSSNATPVQALLHAAGHLLAWGQTRWEELVEYGWKDRLRFLWLWGSGQGLGRLV